MIEQIVSDDVCEVVRKLMLVIPSGEVRGEIFAFLASMMEIRFQSTDDLLKTVMIYECALTVTH